MNHHYPIHDVPLCTRSGSQLPPRYSCLSLWQQLEPGGIFYHWISQLISSGPRYPYKPRVEVAPEVWFFLLSTLQAPEEQKSLEIWDEVNQVWTPWYPYPSLTNIKGLRFRQLGHDWRIQFSTAHHYWQFWRCLVWTSYFADLRHGQAFQSNKL